MFGGNLTDCQVLLDNGLGEHADLILVDSTQLAVPPPPLGTRLAAAVKRLWRVGTRLLRHRPDAMLVFASAGGSFLEKSLVAAAARLLGVRVVMTIRSGHFTDQVRRSALWRRLASPLLRVPHVQLCQGLRWLRFFVDECGLPPTRCVIVENWTASEELLEVGASRSPCPREVIRILFVGRLEPKKGLLDLLAAFEALTAAGAAGGVELLVAGEGSLSTAARERVRAQGLGGAVRFLGWVGRDDMRRLYAQADLFVLPSYTEGLPNSLIEAMAAGLACVATPVGSIPDVVVDGENGLLVEPSDLRGLGRALERLLNDPQLRVQLGAAAHRTARLRFRAVTGVQRIVAVMEGGDACAALLGAIPAEAVE
ncbi:MAG TPA: glycosyltransferase family 4 protein [Gemmatimonadales bacterium]|nr:glycosyltransferase family 4 protein [Gemmatimonadales bacterium]